MDRKRYNQQKNEKTVVITFGTFDYIHAGHEHYLKQAKAKGDELIVVIARDKTVKQIKGKYPLNKERKRVKQIKNLLIANKVILGSHKDKHKVLKKYRPNIIALGYDQFVFTQTLQKTMIDLKLNTEIIRMDAYFPQVYKSSLLKKSESEKIDFNATTKFTTNTI